MFPRRLGLVPLAAVLAVLLAVAPEAAVIDPSLADRLRSTAPDGEIPVIITLADQADPGAVPGMDKRKRRERILRTLREKAEATQGPLRAFLAREGGRKVLPLWIINSVAATVPASVVYRLERFPGVRSIALDDTIHAPVMALDQPSPPEWNLSAIHAPDLWSLGYRGQGTVVANMDTGVDAEHPDLQAKWRGGTNSWYDPNGEHAAPYDAAGHGTLVMGVMVGGDAGGTSIGVAPDAQWIAVKIFDDAGTASSSAIHAGFQWLLDPDDDPQTDDAPDVVNNSWGIDQAVDQCVTEFEADVRVLKVSGIAVVFSAGNAGPAPSTSISPANNPGSFSVGAVASDNVVGFTSSRGPSACDGTVFPHVVAPGVSVKSSDLSFGGMANYAFVSGTSIAAPHVSGAIALLIDAFPLASVGKLENAVKTTTVDLGDPGADNDFGNGLLDSLAAFTMMSRQEFIGVFRNGEWYLDANGDGAWDSGTDTVAYLGDAGEVPVAGVWNGSGTTKIGVFRNGVWFLDTNGNGAWDGTDTVSYFGTTGDVPVAGDWDNTGITKIGVFRNGVWFLDTNGNGAWDGTDTVSYFGTTGDVPVAGDWDNTGITKIGVFRNGVWFLDTNGNGAWDGTDTVSYFGITGDVPVAGDWDNTGITKIGVFRNGVWFLDTNGNGAWDGTDTVSYFGTTGDVPVTGDWDGTGTAKIGVFRNGVWYMDTNGNGTYDDGTDAFAYFGTTGDNPVVGDWDGTGTTKIGVFRNGVWYMDTNGNGTYDDGTDAFAYFGTTGDNPVVGDWDGTGTSKIGVFRNGVWFLDSNGNGAWDGTDTVAYFGDAGDVPVAGDWDGTGATKIGVFRNGVWYLDTNGNGAWDGGTDTVAFFGTTGDQPVAGRW